MSDSRVNLIEENVKCSCKGYNLDKLVQPQILTVLANRDLHGYMIIQELERKNLFFEDRIDNTGVYRTLKTLEDKELVHFEWMLDDSGPAKKNYKITDKGIECLRTWLHTLEDYQKAIDVIIRDAKRVLLEGNNNE